VAKSNVDNEQYIFQFSADEVSTSVKTLTSLEFNKYNGITVSNDSVYVFSIESSTGTVLRYNYVTSTRSTISIDCSYQTSTEQQQASTTNTNRFISYGDDGYLYIMCAQSTTIKTVTGTPDGPVTSYDTNYPFYKVNPSTGDTETLYAQLSNLNYSSAGVATSKSISQIDQILVAKSAAYALTGEPYRNIIKVDLSPQPTFSPSCLPTHLPTNKIAPTGNNVPPPNNNNQQQPISLKPTTSLSQSNSNNINSTNKPNNNIHTN
jgi:hypothetical protein